MVGGAIGGLVLGVVLITSLISRLLMGQSFIDGTVRDRDTKAPIAQAQVVVSNRGWGFIDGQLVWDKDFVYATMSDQGGRFHVDFQVGPSAHVIVTADGYSQFDDYFDKNTTVVIDLTRTLGEP